MSFIKIQNFLGNFSFSILFLVMIIYWIEIIFPSSNNFFIKNINKNFKNPLQTPYNSFLNLKSIGFFGIFLVNISLTILLVSRWLEVGHYPLSNLYESLIFLSWSITSVHLILEFINKAQPVTELSIYSNFLGVVTSPLALFANGFATLSLPKELQKENALVPALQSNWLIMHVTVMILSYAALMVGSLLAFLFLIVTINQNQETENINLEPKLVISRSNTENPKIELGTMDALITKQDTFCFADNNNFVNNDINWQKLEKTSPKLVNFNSLTFFQKFLPFKLNFSNKLAQYLDNLSYRILGIGFPLLTIGILSGAVWANEAWGSYWSWDPKETWAFITWLVFAIYLHTRFSKGWKGKKPAIIATFGFFIVWICYLGVNLFGKGLHSYGWFAS